jgi:hypothetical protein
MFVQLLRTYAAFPATFDFARGRVPERPQAKEQTSRVGHYVTTILDQNAEWYAVLVDPCATERTFREFERLLSSRNQSGETEMKLDLLLRGADAETGVRAALNLKPFSAGSYEPRASDSQRGYSLNPEIGSA